jgi:nucleoside-diphosphate-sugar epimerase
VNVLITGISGRIGANLAKAFLDAGHAVRGLVWPRDRRPKKFEALDVELLDGDLADAAGVGRAVDGMDVVCHLGAAFQGGGPFDEQDYFRTNVRGTFNVLEAARQNANRLKHLFFASTDAAYRKYVPGGMPHPICEDAMPMLPVGWYPLSKQLGEDMCLGYYRAYDLPVTVLRFSMTVAGDEILSYPQFYLRYWLQAYATKTGQAAERVYQQLQSLRQEGQEQLLIARDRTGRSYKKHIADVRDITAAFTAALDKPQVVGEVFQLGGPGPFTWEEAIPYMAGKLGLDYVDLRLDGQVPTFYEFDLDKSVRLFGYHPQYDIFKMIDSAIRVRQGQEPEVIPTYV